MNERTVHGAIMARAGAQPGSIAFSLFRDGWEHETYGEFMEKSRAAARRLKVMGVEEGGRVALVSENRPEWCATFLGILMAGGVAVPLDARLTPPELRNILVDSGASHAVHSGQTAARVAEAAAGLGIQAMDMDSFPWHTAHVQKEGDGFHEGGSNDLAALLYTSGTTGQPKAVMLTHGNLLSDARAVTDLEIISGKDRVLSVLPLHHAYPLMCTFLCPLLVGAAVTYPRGLKGPEIAAAIKETGVTVLVGVPQLLELMYGRIRGRMEGLPWPLSKIVTGFFRFAGALRRRTGFNLPRLFFNPLGRQLRFLASGGARLDPAAMAGLEALGFTVIEGYGLSETSPIACFNPPEKRKPGSVGRAMPSAEIKIIAPSASGEGEVAVRGPMVMKGYWQRPEETARVLKDGWFSTGDLGYLDDEGYLFITGRLKEVIVLPSGKNVYPEEVEKHYGRSDLIKELCALERGGKLWAVVVPDLDALRARNLGNVNEAIRWEMKRLSNELPPHMRIMGYDLSSEELPRTPLGKLRRFLIHEGVKAEGAPAGEDAALLREPAGRKVLECLRPFVPGAVRMEDHLELDLGLDSLKKVELAVCLEQAFSVKVPEDFIAGVQTVGELVGGIKGLGQEREEKAPRRRIDEVLSREPSFEERKKAGLARGGWEWPLTAFFLRILRLFMRVFFRLEVKGLENLPSPPFIIAANHTSYLDGFVIGAGVPVSVFRSLCFLGYSPYFTGRLTSAFARLAHVIAIDPESYVNRALSLSAFALRGGGALAIFPEGGRSFDGSVMEFKKGIGILALKLGVPAVPAWIEGAFRAMPRGSAILRPVKVKLVFGKPVGPSSLDMSRRPEGRDEQQFFADEVRKKVEELGAG